MKKVLLAIALLSPLLSLPGCTTAKYGDMPVAVDNRQDTFKFKIYVGGFSGAETATTEVKPEIDAYMKKHGYKDHKILDKRYNMLPSYYEFTVEFSR